MAHSVHKTAEELEEHFDSPEELDRKITELAQWVRDSQHMIAFTGAGISTSAGIPDYRSGVDTKLPTGPGAWTVRAEEQKGKKVNLSGKRRVRAMLSALPTPTHMALVKLMNEGVLKHVLSQNTDGLHRRSGISPLNLTELHGNTNIEECIDCEKLFLRDFQVNGDFNNEHKTGNKCTKCGGPLKDTIINFGQNLAERNIRAGFNQSARADLCLLLGTSAKVAPASTMAEEVGRKDHGKLVTVNLQHTGVDWLASSQIHAMTDTVMIKLMEKLGYEIPSFCLHRYLYITKKIEPDHSGVSFNFSAVDSDGTPVTLFKSVTIESPAPRGRNHLFDGELTFSFDDINVKPVVTFSFYRHYNEPNLTVDLNNYPFDEDIVLAIEYEPNVNEDDERQWTQPRVDEETLQITHTADDSEMKDGNGAEAAAAPVDLTADTDEGGYAVHIHVCPHIDSCVSAPLATGNWPNLKDNECSRDGCNEKENWICLQCFALFCGRYGNQHMLEHSDSTGHCVVMNCGDLNFWCYNCNAYLHHLTIRPIYDVYAAAHIAKFNEPTPEAFPEPTGRRH